MVKDMGMNLFAAGGAQEAILAAREAGKIRFIGFTGVVVQGLLYALSVQRVALDPGPARKATKGNAAAETSVNSNGESKRVFGQNGVFHECHLRP